MPDAPNGDEMVTATGVRSVEALVYWDWLRAGMPLADDDTPASSEWPYLVPDKPTILRFLLDSRPDWTLGGLSAHEMAKLLRNKPREEQN
jgi:hypothetical protein